ncbi:hypothetical protein EVAR_81629_1 [Eumeta japonica]|uniref:Uncharacterized protein n=1 Tax=Eumeta variegata TaxID=151549 RepID=A0A4C1WF88_EUMVA|nr:hypothetical protein EVAR_81629_1 [Eumeta japonica]
MGSWFFFFLNISKHQKLYSRVPESCARSAGAAALPRPSPIDGDSSLALGCRIEMQNGSDAASQRNERRRPGVLYGEPTAKRPSYCETRRRLCPSSRLLKPFQFLWQLAGVTSSCSRLKRPLKNVNCATRRQAPPAISACIRLFCDYCPARLKCSAVSPLYFNFTGQGLPLSREVRKRGKGKTGMRLFVAEGARGPRADAPGALPAFSHGSLADASRHLFNSTSSP